jgi:hypothetical protein
MMRLKLIYQNSDLMVKFSKQHEYKEEIKTETKFDGGNTSNIKTKTNTKGFEIDFVGIGMLAVMLYISYALSSKSILIPEYIWMLIAALLILEIIIKIIGFCWTFFMSKNFLNNLNK